MPLVSETHGGDDVAIYAIGPQAHLFQGVYEQHYIAHVIGYAACIGPGLKFCDVGGTSINSPLIGENLESKNSIIVLVSQGLVIVLGVALLLCTKFLANFQ